MNDTTIIYLTTNHLPEAWETFHKEQLLKSANGKPIIAVSRIPLGWCKSIPQAQPESKMNIFWSLLRGAKEATTKYIAVAEADTLYPPSHFDFVPPTDDFYYNSHRWACYTWSDPAIYSLKNYIATNAVLVANREAVITALEERFKKFPFEDESTRTNPFMSAEIGMRKAEEALGVTTKKQVDFKTEEPVIQLDTDYFTVFNPHKETVERRHRKELGKIKAFDVPYFGRADSIIKYFK